MRSPADTAPVETRLRMEQILRVVRELPQYRALGVEMLSLEPGYGHARLAWREDLVGNPVTGVVHGGVVTTLLDSLAGAVAFSRVPESGSVATLDLRIDYLKPARPREDLLAVAEVYRLTRSVAFVRGQAHQGEPDNAVAHLTAAFMIGSVGFVAA